MRQSPSLRTHRVRVITHTVEIFSRPERSHAVLSHCIFRDDLSITASTIDTRRFRLVSFPIAITTVLVRDLTCVLHLRFSPVPLGVDRLSTLRYEPAPATSIPLRDVPHLETAIIMMMSTTFSRCRGNIIPDI